MLSVKVVEGESAGCSLASMLGTVGSVERGIRRGRSRRWVLLRHLRVLPRRAFVLRRPGSISTTGLELLCSSGLTQTPCSHPAPQPVHAPIHMDRLHAMQRGVRDYIRSFSIGQNDFVRILHRRSLYRAVWGLQWLTRRFFSILYPRAMTLASHDAPSGRASTGSMRVKVAVGVMLLVAPGSRTLIAARLRSSLRGYS